MLPIVLAGTTSVTLDQETFQKLLPPEPEPAEVAPGALVVHREVQLERVGDERVGSGGAVALHHVQHAGRDAGFQRQAAQFVCGQRRQRRCVVAPRTFLSG